LALFLEGMVSLEEGSVIGRSQEMAEGGMIMAAWAKYFPPIATERLAMIGEINPTEEQRLLLKVNRRVISWF
jgi:hypothetical protein